MSATPPKKEGVEPAQSPDENDPRDMNAEETQAQGLGYEFEVKEQDRWLPIANGTSISLACSLRFDLRKVSLPPARRSNGRCCMSTYPPIARLCVESRPSTTAASHSASLCT